MKWTPLKFGIHKGKTWPQVLFRDPGWFFWAYNLKKFDEYQVTLNEEVENIYKKARKIAIPKTDKDNYEVEHTISRTNTGDKYVYFGIVPATQGKHIGHSQPIRGKFIDMYIPRYIGSYDKGNYKRFLECLKIHCFGDSSFRMTKNRCEDFFNDPSNFDI